MRKLWSPSQVTVAATTPRSQKLLHGVRRIAVTCAVLVASAGGLTMSMAPAATADADQTDRLVDLGDQFTDEKLDVNGTLFFGEPGALDI